MRDRRFELQRGSSLVTAMVLVALMSALLSAYYIKTMYQVAATKNSMDATRGFYAAEAGLNIRAEEIRQLFVASNRPTGTSPVPVAGQIPCHGGDQGTGDFACQSRIVQDRTIYTYVEEPPGNPKSVIIPPGEPFQNLNASAYDFNATSIAVNHRDKPEAILQLNFKSRVVPMFQFAAFFDKDLEITPGPPLTLNGPIHSNGDIYAAASTSVDIGGDMTTHGKLFRGRKDSNTCWTGPFRVLDPVNPLELPTCSGTRREIFNSDLGPWNSHIIVGVDDVAVPTPDDLDPIAGKNYWDNADIRIMLDAGDPTFPITARNRDGSIHTANTSLALCAANTLATGNSFFNNREGKSIRMLDVHMEQFITCLADNGDLIDGKTIDETSNGGLVFYFGVEGPGDTGINGYGVRLKGGEQLHAPGEPDIEGLTVATGQAAYVQGHYNRINKKPAAVLSDSINVLSTAWPTGDAWSTAALNTRIATPTTINAAFLTGSDTTGELEGTPGQNLGLYSGGLHNLKRMHEKWTGVPLTYRGSLVSLNKPIHVQGKLLVCGSGTQYCPPIRDFNYDTDFNNADNLPPLTPVFVYTRQRLFVRDFEF